MAVTQAKLSRVDHRWWSWAWVETPANSISSCCKHFIPHAPSGASVGISKHLLLCTCIIEVRNYGFTTKPVQIVVKLASTPTLLFRVQGLTSKEVTALYVRVEDFIWNWLHDSKLYSSMDCTICKIVQNVQVPWCQKFRSKHTSPKWICML